MSILDLVIAFKEACGKINKDKIRSQIQLDEIKELVDQWKGRASDVKKVEDILSKHWKYLPITQRKDYIQKTYDFLHYGFDAGTCTYLMGEPYGLVQIYNDTYEYIVRQYRF